MQYLCNNASNSEPRRRQAKVITPLSSQAVFTLHRYSQHVPLLPYVNKSRPDCLQRPTSASALTEGPYVAAPTTSPKGRQFILQPNSCRPTPAPSDSLISPSFSHRASSTIPERKSKTRVTCIRVHGPLLRPVGKPPLVSLCVTVPAASQRACSSTRARQRSKWRSTTPKQRPSSSNCALSAPTTASSDKQSSAGPSARLTRPPQKTLSAPALPPNSTARPHCTL